MKITSRALAAAATALTLAACGGNAAAQPTRNVNNIRVCHHYRTQRAYVKNLAEPSIADALKWMGWVGADAGEATPGTQLASDLGEMSADMQTSKNLYAISTRVLKDCEALGVTFQP
jgi:ABC-type glycerol-3-phosphate transport system substrate-binding protein